MGIRVVFKDTTWTEYAEATKIKIRERFISLYKEWYEDYYTITYKRLWWKPWVVREIRSDIKEYRNQEIATINQDVVAQYYLTDEESSQGLKEK